MRSSTRRGVPSREPFAHRLAAIRTAGLIAVTLCLLAPAARAGDDALKPGTGTLQVLEPDRRPAAAFPLRHTEVHAEIAGSIARVTVEQEFENPFARSIEAVYVFPLPHEAAVDDLELRIGERIVRGEIRTRQAAREIYERARDQGQLAALLDQERPNIFTQRVANIQPGHVIAVRIRYVENLEHREGTYEMVFPTVVGPRFIPGRPLGSATPASTAGLDDELPPSPEPDLHQGGNGWAPDTDRVPDASRITPPVVPPGHRTGHDIQIVVDLDAGVPLQALECPSHAVDTERLGSGRARVQLRPADTIPNKDFVLRYRVAGTSPEIGILAHRDAADAGGFGYFTLQFQPAAKVTSHEARPKELIFLLDCSGSMDGEPIARSKSAMRWAMQHLGPDDTFQIIRFSDQASSFAPRPVPSTSANVQHGLRYVDRLHGEGGTQMLSGIRAALELPADSERLRIVCMLTDGFIGNETEILGAVRQTIGDARLFSFGIGSSVNRYLLDALAEEGRGSVDYVPLDGETRPIVERFYDRIAKPYLTDISIDWGDLDVQGVYPQRIPDLFAGQPLMVAGRYRQGGRSTIVVRGRLGREPFERRLRVALPAREPRNAALGTLWARRRIDTLTQRMVHREDPALVDEVTGTALAFGLMTRYTSFVAVDNQVVSKDGKPMLVPQPVEMPVGVSYEGVFGSKGEIDPSTMILFRAGASQAPAAPRKRSGAWKLSLPSWRPTANGSQRTAARGQSEELNLPPAARPALPVAVDEAEMMTGLMSWTGRLQVILAPESERALVGDPIRLRIEIRNVGTESIEVPAYLIAEDLTLRLRRDGKQVPGTKPASRFSRPMVRLEPGAVRSYTLVFDGNDARFLSTGRYELVLAGIGAYTLVEPPARCAIVVQ